MSQFHNSN